MAYRESFAMPRILILESYGPTRQALAMILEREGWEVTLSQTDQEAFEALRQLQADGAINEDARRAAYLVEGELRARDEDFDAENDAYTRGLADWPDEPSLLYARALMWERRDDIPRAEADLRTILVADPENVAALNALGYTLADRTERYREALELIERAVAHSGRQPSLYVHQIIGNPQDMACICT
mgnify:CR=1 FL=1